MVTGPACRSRHLAPKLDAKDLTAGDEQTALVNRRIASEEAGRANRLPAIPEAEEDAYSADGEEET
jgi:hypothetical protein